MDTHFPFSVARKEFSALYDRVEQGSAAVVQRRGSKPVAVVDAEELERLLALHFPFDVQVRVGKDTVAMWPGPLPVHAQADDFESATRALAAELIEYAEEWERELRFAPNHKDAWGFVRRIELAGSEQAVIDMLVADAENASATASAS
ncbi:MAG: type II toxin-antitoxin system Phd/YefM family antitoxin [Acidobacteria bacterium]|nr:type II toxin-antitoxin system Phd/YefM family antitoxin [Acidobacteriota bacterium]